MKHIRPGRYREPKLSIPKNFEIKLLRALISDLGMCDEISSDIEFSTLPDLFDPRRMVDEGLATHEEQEKFFKRYQIGALLKKYPPEVSSGTKLAAYNTFLEGEKFCKLYNEENYKLLTSLDSRHPLFFGVIAEIRKDIQQVLGNSPDLGYIYRQSMHGPGSSIGDYREGRVTPFYKWSTLPYSVTRGCLPYAKELILSDPRWIGALDDWYRKKTNNLYGYIDMEDFWNTIFKCTDENRITTVPKSAKTDRTIAIEPVLNVFIQLGVDRLIRRRLRRIWGYDLNSQTRNQELARLGSINDDLTTVDKRMASETVSLKICELLLPAQWYSLLLDLRSPFGNLEGDIISYEKLSSMGNGFTFAIESLIFAALVRCSIRRTRSKRVSAVFGDDVVLPTTAYGYYRELLKASGFLVNEDKSFSDGLFRESCGKDYINGNLVRPFFLKKKVRTLRDLFYVHNSFYLLQESLPWAWNITFKAVLRLCKKYIPPSVRKQIYGPPSECLDGYLFSTKYLRRNRYGQPCYLSIKVRAIDFQLPSHLAYDYYYFRKLMALGPRPHIHKWSLHHKYSNGNAFSITRRDRTTLRIVRVDIP